ncbi:MAG: nucleotidyltransferase domain-containing protein [archaeon]
MFEKSNICSKKYIKTKRQDHIMLKDILDTKIKRNIATFFTRQKGSHQVSDIARKLSISKSRASECLRDLEKSGLLKKRTIGRSVIYELSSTRLAESITRSLNQDENLKKDIESLLKKHLKKLNPISIAIFGSSVTGIKPSSDIDVIVLLKEEIEGNEIYRISAALTEDIGIDISILPMTEEEFIKKAKAGEEFILNVAATHRLIYGKELEDIIWQEKQEKKNQKNS